MCGFSMQNAQGIRKFILLSIVSIDIYYQIFIISICFIEHQYVIMAMRQLKITKNIMNREVDSLDTYLREIARIELISVLEEEKLVKEME